MWEGKPLQWEFAEEAHEIGKQVAKEILGGKYEFVLTPHIDKGHIHNHLIFNAASFTNHERYHSNKRSYHEIRRASDRLCREHGPCVIVPGQDVENLKRAATTMSFLTEHGIGSYEEMMELMRCRCRRIHPHQGGPAGHGTANHRPRSSGRSIPTAS